MKEFIQNPGLFPHQIDMANDRVLLVKLTESSYRSASFLDARLLSDNVAMSWVDWRRLEIVNDPVLADARFIFHIGHVGSTLISRLLGESPGVLALREPFILRQFSELKALRDRAHSPWPPQYFEARLRTALSWFSRKFRPDQKVIVKATSFASELASDIVTDERKAIFLYLRPERYIQTILAGENSRRELAVLSASRVERLNQKLGGDVYKLWELDEIERAAISWLSEMATLERASTGNIMWVDFDEFLSNPAEILFNIARFTNLPIKPAEAEMLAKSKIMQQYSKAPEHGYSSQLRDELLSQVAHEHGTKITRVINWLENEAANHILMAKVIQRGAESK